MVRSISILGSTGSIGRQTVAVAEHLGLRVRAITTNRSIALAEEQARRLHPAMVAVTDEASAKELRVALADTDIKVWGGEHALVEAAVISEADTVVTAVSGAVGLKPTLEAIRKGRRIALANKTTQKAILEANGLTDANRIREGQPLYIPAPGAKAESAEAPAPKPAEKKAKGGKTVKVIEAPEPAEESPEEILKSLDI